MKKVEEVVYDLSIRGLAKKTEELSVNEKEEDTKKAENEGLTSEIEPEEGADGAASAKTAEETKKDWNLWLKLKEEFIKGKRKDNNFG